jgi:putative Mn2+ efflux pump MntP
MLQTLLIALALSADAFAVTAADCCAWQGAARRRLWLLPVAFGLFQGAMPVVGYYVGSLAAGVINAIAGPVALVALGAIGLKMVIDGAKALRAARHPKQPAPAQPGAPFQVVTPALSRGLAERPQQTGETRHSGLQDDSAPAPAHAASIPTILAQAVATSIDALVAGVGFIALGDAIWSTAAIITFVTAACCVAALALGRRIGALLGDGAQLAGGIVLILIGLKACFL